MRKMRRRKEENAESSGGELGIKKEKEGKLEKDKKRGRKKGRNHNIKDANSEKVK